MKKINKVTNIEFQINYLLLQIEKNILDKSSDIWTHADFQNLSEKILEKTKYSLSYTTLKRIWAKIPHTGMPSQSTLDALAKLIDFQNWNDFIKKNESNIEQFKLTTPINELITKKNNPHITNIKTINFIIPYKKIVVRLIFILLVFLLLLVIRYFISKEKTNSIIFQTDDTIGIVPFTSYINYKVSMLKTKNIKVWVDDANKFIDLDKSNILFTTMTIEPGVKNVNLYVNDKVIKSIRIHAQTNGWIGILNSRSLPHPILLSTDSIKQNNCLTFKPTYITSNSISQASFINSTDFELDGDNFIMETRFKYIKINGFDVCQKTQITIDCENDFISIPFIHSGCLTSCKLFVSEKEFLGRNFNLIKFSGEFENWRYLIVKVIDKNITIYLDNMQIFSESYTKSLGKIKLLKFSFFSNGAIDDFKIYNPFNKENIIQDNFDLN